MLEFAEFLTLNPSGIQEEFVQGLREAGWTDADIIDIVHITALFNYMVRIADGLGIELQEGRGWEEASQRLSFKDETAPKNWGTIAGAPVNSASRR